MDVWDEVVGQDAAVAALRAAAGSPEHPATGMTHAWLFVGPPGSGRSVAARAFAAALQCRDGGCGECLACHTVLAGTHADVHRVVPQGLTIGVDEMRSVVLTAARAPSGGRWQIVLIEDADRLTEAAANALLKAIEEPAERTVFLLCAPSTHPEDVSVTIRSRCRAVALRTPSTEAVAGVLVKRDGVEPERARWAAQVAQGHVGRARRLATDEEAAARRQAVVDLPARLSHLRDCLDAADQLVRAAEEEAAAYSSERDEPERDALAAALGAGGTGKGAAAANRSANAALKELDKRHKSRATRAQRDALDRALVDLAAFYRDVMITQSGASVSLAHPDKSRDTAQVAAALSPEQTLERLEAVLACREALEWNVKPRIAVEAMAAALRLP